jgi:hypothetical protein
MTAGGGGDLQRVANATENYIDKITSLKRRPRSQEALALINRVANFVRPIMKSWKLRAGTLCEMFPKNPNLLGLNVNHGQKICLRLRPAHDEQSFLLFEDIVGTMLHELVHNQRGPHDVEFYRLLDRMKSELEELMAKGWRGDSFYGTGRVLGHGSSSLEANLNPQLAVRRRAEKLSKRASWYKGSGEKLGNGNIGPKFGASVSLRDRIRIAAERRAEDAKWCASARQDLSVEELGGDSDIEELGISVISGTNRSSMAAVNNVGNARTLGDDNQDDIQEIGSRAATDKPIFIDLT